MSVRAHRITKIEHQEETTFSLSDEELIDLIEDKLCPQLDEDGCGVVELTLKYLQLVYQDAKKNGVKEETTELLEKMIKQAKKNGWVQYYCF